MKQNKLEPYIIDNMSDDGSWEYLQQQHIPSHRFDTGGSFHLEKLQEEIIKTTHKIKPDWVVYNGCDLFPVTLEPLADYLEKIDNLGYNVVTTPIVGLVNTGEVEASHLSPFHTYYYYTKEVYGKKHIHKYSKNYTYRGDKVYNKKEKLITLDGVAFEYGHSESAEERQKTLRRRQKAWKEGLPLWAGKHYLKSLRNDYIKERKKCRDIRNGQYWKFLKKLQELAND